MNTFISLVCTMLVLAISTFGQAPGQVRTKPLEVKVDRFDVTDAILRDGLSELSLKNVGGLHLGFEEIIRDKIEVNPDALGPRFSFHLEGKSVREILDELCISDVRYARMDLQYKRLSTGNS